jgi:hypothetical protein
MLRPMVDQRGRTIALAEHAYRLAEQAFGFGEQASAKRYRRFDSDRPNTRQACFYL